MIILALDTTNSQGSLALARDEQTLEVHRILGPKGFAQILYPEINALLARHSVSLDQIDLYAAASGPGSFTGIRIGLTAIKALAEICRKPAVTVSNLRALAAAGSGPWRAAIQDARRGEIYAAVYDQRLDPILPETVGDWDQIQSLLAGYQLEYLVRESAIVAPDGPAPLPPESNVRTVSDLAGHVAQVARLAALAGKTSLPEALEANYIRRSDAEGNWQDSTARVIPHNKP